MQKKGSKFFDVFNKNQNNNDNDKNMDPNSLDAVSSMANSEIRKLHETISQLKFENETYMQKMNSTLEQAENTKLEFKNELKTYTDKIKSLEDEIKIYTVLIHREDSMNVCGFLSKEARDIF